MLMRVIANRTVTLLDKEPKYNSTPYNLLFDNYNIITFVRKIELENIPFRGMYKMNSVICVIFLLEQIKYMSEMYKMYSVKQQ